MTTLHSLTDLLIDELKDLYSAETQLVKALTEMARAASDDRLKAGFSEHLDQTKSHVERLERALEMLDATPQGKTCKAMKGLIEEGSAAIETEAPDAIRDANLIGAAQRVEHYEIAAYGTARAFAETLNEGAIVSLLQETLAEESETDKNLSVLSEAINRDAKAVGMEEENPDKAE